MIEKLKHTAKALLNMQSPNKASSKISGDDVFLVSYPRSGNTWTRNLVAHLVYPHERIESFDDLQQLVPDIYVGISPYNSNRYRVIKTHESFLTRHGAIFGRTEANLYRRNIYIVRHPIKTLASYYDYQYHLFAEPEHSLETFITRVLNNAFWPGGWQEHVLSWYAMKDKYETLFIRYEDLDTNSVLTLQKIADFLNVSLSDERAQEIVNLCSREAMINMEERSSTAELTKNPEFRFVQNQHAKRRVYDQLTPELKSIICEYSERAMKLFGYTSQDA